MTIKAAINKATSKEWETVKIAGQVELLTRNAAMRLLLGHDKANWGQAPQFTAIQDMARK